MLQEHNNQTAKNRTSAVVWKRCELRLRKTSTAARI